MEILNEKLNDYIKRLGEAKILVIGDLALDEMVYGDTERISREAPVLILQHTKTQYNLGGASNAANNVSAINNGKVAVIGIVGNDYQSEELKNAFKNAGINYDGLITDANRKTITKTRISGTCTSSITQQIVRIDRQTNLPVSKETEDKIIEQAKLLIPKYDAIILSDYHIGTLSGRVVSEIINIADKHGKKIIVDAQRDLTKYKGVFSMTPNLPDTQKHVGFYLNTKEDFVKAGNILREQTGAKNILITCGGEGMVVIDNDGKYVHIPAFNKAKVFDVTGAGDTVTAIYTLALAIGAEPVYAAIIGNIAAGIVVKQYGCATTTIEEILSAAPQKIQLDY